MMEQILRTQADVLKVQNELLTILPDLHDKPYICEIKPYKKRRSLDANAYFHVLVDKIAKATQQSTQEVKTQLVLDYGAIATEGGEQVIVALPKCADVKTYYPYAKWVKDFTAKNQKQFSQYLFYKQTHLYDSAEMATLIDGAIQEAKQLGIETLTPVELENLKGYKKENQNDNQI